jgi:hypothetical protein
MFIIEDELHAEWCGEFPSFAAAIDELKRRAAVPWDQIPNAAPCINWRTCRREYHVVEYDDSTTPWRELRRWKALDVSPSGALWASDFPPATSGE